MRSFKYWLWLVPLGLVWPFILFIFVFVIGRGAFSLGLIKDLTLLIPMSLATGMIFLFLWSRTERRACKEGLLLGYVFAGPFAFAGIFAVGLAFPADRLILGSFMYGAAPLLVGMLLGAGLPEVYFRAAARARRS